MDKFSTNSYFQKLDDYFSAVNYVSAGQLYLLDNPLLERKLPPSDIKSRIVGHWGTVPGQNLLHGICPGICLATCLSGESVSLTEPEAILRPLKIIQPLYFGLLAMSPMQERIWQP